MHCASFSCFLPTIYRFYGYLLLQKKVPKTWWFKTITLETLWDGGVQALENILLHKNSQNSGKYCQNELFQNSIN